MTLLLKLLRSVDNRSGHRPDVPLPAYADVYQLGWYVQ